MRRSPPAQEVKARTMRRRLHLSNPPALQPQTPGDENKGS
ncbi:hypothetical protein E2C01_082412 [Portunus trituberculatus]|uniref:Uncharacterized protein n=1 Tax=Portunus trituberculatus TaxID=210409 RepID=A0A5B7J1K9_PORTR|nr:hypothetical protein [Portunus trituberculatus]